MRKGDLVFVYHTGDVKAIVGLAKVAADPKPDPKNEKFAIVELAAERETRQPVTLAQVKADPAFADFSLVRIGRLSVMPVPPDVWRRSGRWRASADRVSFRGRRRRHHAGRSSPPPRPEAR